MAGPAADKPMTENSSAPRRSSWQGFAPLAETVAALTVPMLGRRGLVAGRLMIEWPHIVGEQLAARTAPERLTRAGRAADGGTLQVRVGSGAVALEVQHQASQLLERINSYFGFRAVGRLRLVHGPLPNPSPPAPPPPAPSPDAEALIAAHLADVEEPRLKQALAALGRRLHAPARSPGT
jgi:hypothetical protein